MAKKSATVEKALDPEEALLRQVVTLGMLLKILLAVGGLLVAIGAYEVNQLDKLRDQANGLQSAVGGLQEKVVATQQKVDTAQQKLDTIQSRLDASGNSMAEILKAIADTKSTLERSEAARRDKAQ